jgi:hypothetical protein
MRNVQSFIAVLAVMMLGRPVTMSASNHREAPITGFDHKADITDVYAFVSYGPNTAAGERPRRVTLIMCVDPLLEPANGPTFFPFDPEILYEIKIDNDNDALADVTFQFRFNTEQRLPGVFTGMLGVGANGAVAPANSPSPVTPGTLIVPPQITSFESPGLGQRQSYSMTMIRKGQAPISDGRRFFAVPNNIGSRTMDYPALFRAGTYSLPNGVSVFAGTVDDPFFIDLGGAFDTVNFRTLGSGVPGVLTDTEDRATRNFATDTVSGFAVNAIAIEVPIEMLTRTGQFEAATSAAATIGVWGSTSRQGLTVRLDPDPIRSIGPWRQIQRMGNPLVNELLIGIGSKDRFSMDQPVNDGQFAPFLLDPVLPRAANALYAGVLPIPNAPRTDLLPAVTYAAPIAAPGTPAGPVADMLRLNTGVPATPVANINRLGLIGGDAAGYPNGRRLQDDVVDILLRIVAGGVLNADFNKFPNNRLGDGVNVNDGTFKTAFPFLADCPSGRDRRHLDPGEEGGGPVK